MSKHTPSDELKEINALLRKIDDHNLAGDIGRAIHAYIKTNYIPRAKLIELVKTNQKGQFEDDAGHICWYLDDLVMLLESLNLEGGQDG